MRVDGKWIGQSRKSVKLQCSSQAVPREKKNKRTGVVLQGPTTSYKTAIAQIQNHYIDCTQLNDEDPIRTDDNRLLNLFKKQNKKKRLLVCRSNLNFRMNSITGKWQSGNKPSKKQFNWLGTWWVGVSCFQKTQKRLYGGSLLYATF